MRKKSINKRYISYELTEENIRNKEEVVIYNFVSMAGLTKEDMRMLGMAVVRLRDTNELRVYKKVGDDIYDVTSRYTITNKRRFNRAPKTNGLGVKVIPAFQKEKRKRRKTV